MLRPLVAFILVTIAIAASAMPIEAHGRPTCSQLTVAANVMQREVDGFRSTAARLHAQANRTLRSDPHKAASNEADAKFLTLRAGVEQDRIDGIRHNISHCTNDDDDDKHHS